jgi:hypothetical protein
VSFIKYFGTEMLGTVGRKSNREASNENGEDILQVGNDDHETSAHGEKDNKEPIVNESQRTLFKTLLIDYFSGVEKHLAEEHQVYTIYFYLFLIIYVLMDLIFMTENQGIGSQQPRVLYSSRRNF